MESFYNQYTKINHIFKENEVLQNNNGYEYKVINVLNQNEVLFERIIDGEQVIGVNPCMYNKNGKTKVLEWCHGKYL